MRTWEPSAEFEFRLLGELFRYNRGRGRAVRREDLASLLDRPTMRGLRKARENLVAKRFPIGVNERGYFYCVTQDDFRASQAYTLKKIRGFLRQMRRERWAWEAERERMAQGREGEQMELICVQIPVMAAGGGP